ncbi:accessory secretory protein Asp3 [Lactobacillus colini]|uniref:Accessory secretory protein Asp3 n=1 Tax=Lactobacillus colini TaxID=1819254 RepID=A0ABS4MGP6_9LACO|nr:accessory Sec system protein Asp3 [Lactobacillus colini]MBP2058872.1 accessory secretory protein Asp3 [Lactobacillus colini]
MQAAISHIYWHSLKNTYMYGSKVKKYTNNYLDFENNLMSSGQIIVSWKSSQNYQLTKEVPSLPILLNGHDYKIAVKADVVPKDSLIYELSFFDQQDNQIKHIAFQSSLKTFTYPANARSYQLSLINGGCEKIFFKKIEITSANVPDQAFDDVYFDYSTLNLDRQNLILIQDGKRSREVKNINFKGQTAAIAYVDWQATEKLSRIIKTWFSQNKIKNAIIFSTNLKIDKAITDLDIKNSDLKIITSTDLYLNIDSTPKKHQWLKREVYDPDWLMIASQINKYLAGNLIE